VAPFSTGIMGIFAPALTAVTRRKASGPAWPYVEELFDSLRRKEQRQAGRADCLLHNSRYPK
jgi:hypothetical protein